MSADEAGRRRDKRLKRSIEAFLRDYPDSATRDRANVTLKEIEAISGESERGEAIRAVVAGIRRKFRLTTDPLTAVGDYPQFKERLKNLAYVERLANLGQLAEVEEPESSFVA